MRDSVEIPIGCNVKDLMLKVRHIRELLEPAHVMYLWIALFSNKYFQLRKKSIETVRGIWGDNDFSLKNIMVNIFFLDINECAANPCGSGYNCINLPGSNQCQGT